MPGSSTRKTCSKSNPFWFSPSLQKSFSVNQSVPHHITDAEYWSSSLEFQTYRKLKMMFSDSEIIRQNKLLILPEVKPFFKQWSWKVDFCVKSKKLKEPLYIESKGEWIKHDKSAEREFVHMLQVLQMFHPAIFHNLILVSNSTFRLTCTNLQTIHLSAITRLIENKCKLA